MRLARRAMIDVHGAFAQVSQVFYSRETSHLLLNHPIYILYPYISTKPLENAKQVMLQESKTNMKTKSYNASGAMSRKETKRAHS